MGCQKRLSGKKYDSSSGHAFIIGGISKGIIGMLLYYIDVNYWVITPNLTKYGNLPFLSENYA